MYLQLPYARLVFEEWCVIWVLRKGSLDRQIFVVLWLVFGLEAVTEAAASAVQGRLVTLDAETK